MNEITELDEDINWLQWLVEEECYKEAAKIRDKISKEGTIFVPLIIK